jgi:hypothetical protein
MKGEKKVMAKDMDDQGIEAPITINIGNICDGAAVDAFEKKLAECLANICDLNTPATASRTVVLKVKLKPREDRVQINAEFTCSTTLPSFVPKTSRLFVGRDDEGNLYGLTEDPRQIKLFQPPKPRELPPVVSFKPAEKK